MMYFLHLPQERKREIPEINRHFFSLFKNAICGMRCRPNLNVFGFSFFSSKRELFWKSREASGWTPKAVHCRQRRVGSLQVPFHDSQLRQALQGGVRPLGHPHVLLLLKRVLRPVPHRPSGFHQGRWPGHARAVLCGLSICAEL